MAVAHAVAHPGALDELKRIVAAPPSSGAQDGSRVRGPLLGVIALGGREARTWLRCDAHVGYRFVSGPAGPLRFALRNEAELDEVLPGIRLGAERTVRAGAVDLEVAIAGRLELEGVAPQCGESTAYVRAIVVGAYRVRLREGQVLGAQETPEVALGMSETVGDLNACRNAPARMQPDCMVPLAFALQSYEGGHGESGRSAMEASSYEAGVELWRGAGEPSGVAGGVCRPSLATSGDLRQDLARLVAACGGDGMAPVTDAMTGEQDERGVADRFPMKLDAGGCYRFFGVGGPGVVDLDMALKGPSGAMLARDFQPGPWSVLSLSGPVCVDATGDYELLVAVERGGGRFAVQAWRSGP